ncbi:unnamed protein product [Leptosia nina]|uniref:Peptidase S1 domain-containing protein n=1 Tax=Leptosia nina TaxID=320188 RepID=A0AAV1K028_9NEOP
MYWFIFLILAVRPDFSKGLNNAMKDFFDSMTIANATSVEDFKCRDIQLVDETAFEGCYSCYRCENERYIAHSRAGSFTRNLRFSKMTNGNCATENLCCVSQSAFTSVRTQHDCGKINREGRPRSVRPALRHVLPGQYPWRVWIYADGDKKCVGTYINFNPDVLVTTASCMSYIQNSDALTVRVDRDDSAETAVTNFILHPDFHLNQVEAYKTPKNNIALVKMESKLPNLRPICIPEARVDIGSPCVVVSADNIYINAIVPVQEKCQNTDPAILCAMVPPKDYTPEDGSGLFCVDQNASESIYLLHGIMVDNDDHVIKYLNISHYDSWITEQIKSL